ncbi:hypothetical protein S7711_01663 [Stachybotrys chartarum IBT 7711]|uniref:Major facilitator superfamily (MFS) profile domain-containing protein n=1 Tax=Stachybotrys chartarum (strain CBS 109288 / IBT 7711) TaxID=1280523 RepID=A0A084AV78_STACB|nr:hypothetical protein S7711_01663 [Stachybotrys chartarum IBT 7711]
MALPSRAMDGLHLGGVWEVSSSRPNDETASLGPESPNFPDTPDELPSGIATPSPLVHRESLLPASRQKPVPGSLRRPSLDYAAPPPPPSNLPDPVLELASIRSRQPEPSRASNSAAAAAGLPEETGSPAAPIYQGRPPEFRSLATETVFVLVCAAGQVMFALTFGHVVVSQLPLRSALGVPPTQTPWLVGASLLSSGLSVVIAGSLADLAPPKPMMVGAFAWMAAWNVASAFAVRPRLAVFFFVTRAMQGLAVGVVVSASMSILGRIYQPGVRKNRVFSLMAAGAPIGFWVGCVQGGALSQNLPWIFASTSMLLVCFAVAAFLVLPPMAPAADTADADAPSLKHFDYAGAALASGGCGLLLFGLTQGSSAHWSPYTYTLIIVGFAMFVAFYFVERRVARPLIPNGLWRTPGFRPLLVAYFLGFGGFNGAWQFYAIQFWQRYQGASPLTTSLYLLPNGIVGVLAAWIVSKTLHVFPGHWILTASMVCFALGPVFFLPQSPSTSYWALSMPGVALATFGPDLSFAAAAIFITSSVPRSYQGSAGSLLVTVQNLTSAIMTSVSDSVGIRVERTETGEIGLEGIRAIWWFGLASALTGAIICATMVRIPKSEEKEHVL